MPHAGWSRNTLLVSLHDGPCMQAIHKKHKICTVFLSSYRNIGGSLGEQESLWEHELFLGCIVTQLKKN